MREIVRHLRAGERGPQGWCLFGGVGPLGLEQVTWAFGISRRGTYAIGDALVAARMARRETVKGKALLVVEEPGRDGQPASLDQATALPHAALAEFDAAMGEIDRLLAGSSGHP